MVLKKKLRNRFIPTATKRCDANHSVKAFGSSFLNPGARAKCHVSDDNLEATSTA